MSPPRSSGAAAPPVSWGGIAPPLRFPSSWPRQWVTAEGCVTGGSTPGIFWVLRAFLAICQGFTPGIFWYYELSLGGSKIPGGPPWLLWVLRGLLGSSHPPPYCLGYWPEQSSISLSFFSENNARERETARPFGKSERSRRAENATPKDSLADHFLRCSISREHNSMEAMSVIRVYSR